jgi:hypothetical protein
MRYRQGTSQGQHCHTHPKHFVGRLILSISLFLAVAGATASSAYGQQLRLHKSMVTFISEAPLEFISAKNDQISGIVDFHELEFLIRIKNDGFVGFNSPLQQEHFFENYIESHKHPKSSFAGKIIGEIDLSKPGTYQLKAKGWLDIHGEKSERIIPITIEVRSDKISFQSKFSILLADHKINIPRIVNQKIAEEIEITIKGELK